MLLASLAAEVVSADAEVVVVEAVSLAFPAVVVVVVMLVFSAFPAGLLTSVAMAVTVGLAALGFPFLGPLFLLFPPLFWLLSNSG